MQTTQYISVKKIKKEQKMEKNTIQALDKSFLDISNCERTHSQLN